MSDPKMILFLNQLSGSHNFNTPISSLYWMDQRHLIWSQQCTVSLKARELISYATEDKKQLKTNDPNFELWDQQNSLTMSQMFNTMDDTLVASYILYDTPAQI